MSALTALDRIGGPCATRERIQSTIHHLKTLMAYRSAGESVCYTSDPSWLINMAINRRAGWPEDIHQYGNVRINHRGQVARRSVGRHDTEMRRLRHRVNQPRLIVREREARFDRIIHARLAHRFYTEERET